LNLVYILTKKKLKNPPAKMMRKNLLKIFLGAGLVLALNVKPACAEFSLSVKPYEGGYDLNFGKIGLGASGANQEVIVNIRSDIGKQYRLIQTFFEPLTNSQGISIPTQNTCFLYALRGSAKYGTLSVEQETPVNFARSIIYTSNSQGLSDSFTLVYSLKGPFQVPSGSYRGRVGFSLEAIDSNQPPATAFMNILCEVESAEYIQIKTLDGDKRLRLNSRSLDSRSCLVDFNVLSGLGSQYRIIQSITEPLRSSEGFELPEGAVVFQMEQITKGSGPHQETPVSMRPQTIYSSDGKGNPENFIENFRLVDLSGVKAGTYKTNVAYLIEESNGQTTKRLGNYLLEVEVVNEFDLELKTESGGGVIQFKDIGPNKPARTFWIEVTVKTNLGKPYLVTQKVTSDLTNKAGKSIPSKYFTIRTETVNNTKGILKFPQNTEFKPGDTVLFVSDKKGSADTFKTVYELSAPVGVIAGDYSASVVYSLSEL
jgi:hypothetical protein